MLSRECNIFAVCTDPDGGSLVQHVTGADVRQFGDRLMGALFDGDIGLYDFTLGFAAAVDALGGGRIDFSDPVGTVRAAWADVNDIGPRPPYVTDVMRAYCEGVVSREAV